MDVLRVMTKKILHFKFITDVNPIPGNAYRLTKCHNENRPLPITALVCNTAVENLSRLVKDQLKPLANTCKYRLQDTNDVIFERTVGIRNMHPSPWCLICII